MKTTLKFLWVLVLLSGNLLFAQAEQVLKNPLQPPETGSPRETLFGFIEDCNLAFDFMTTNGRSMVDAEDRVILTQRLQGYFDLENLPNYIYTQASMEAAVALKEILDRMELPLPEQVPGPGDLEDLDVWKIPGTHLQIRKMTEGPNEGAFLFSKEVVSRIPEVYKQVKHLPVREDGLKTTPGLMQWFRSEPVSPWVSQVVNVLPDVFRRQLLEHSVWQWAGLVLVYLIGLLLMVLAYKIGRSRASKFRQDHIVRYFLTLSFPVMAMLIPLWMKHLIKNDLVLGGGLLKVTDFSLGLLVLLAALRLIWAIGNRLLVMVVNHPKIEENQLDTQLIRLVGRVLTVITVVVVFLEGGKRLGIPLSTLVAGAGISGLAVALAAQDSLKNILGSVMLILDKPFAVGDRIIFKSHQGFVQEIGLRSTKIKLLTGNMASIPNEVLARLEIENVSARPSLRKSILLHLPLDTPWEKSQRALARIKEWMQDHEGMPEDQRPRIFMNDLTQVSCVIQVMFWYAPAKTTDMLAFSEKAIFEMLKILAEEEIELKVPIQLPSATPQG
ncbi:mechanosensitive ion channel family protein [Kiritimatiellaeota bacterium B1221]|nr:mechanosensitive ion channel family protein [Kiritimatiellaeota bacterium B1221]